MKNRKVFFIFFVMMMVCSFALAGFSLRQRAAQSTLDDADHLDEGLVDP